VVKLRNLRMTHKTCTAPLQHVLDVHYNSSVRTKAAQPFVVTVKMSEKVLINGLLATPQMVQHSPHHHRQSHPSGFCNCSCSAQAHHTLNISLSELLVSVTPFFLTLADLASVD